MARLDDDGNLIFEDGDWETDDNPFKQRFENYRSEADRRATEYSDQQKLLAELQSDDPDTQRAAAQRLGFDFVADDDASLNEVDPYDSLRQEVEALKSERQQEREQAAQQAEQNRIAAAVDGRLEAMGLDKEDGDWVLARAVMLQPGEDGLPDLAAAYAQLQARDAAAQERWRTSKRTPAMSRGKQGTEQKSIVDMTDEERISYVMEQHEIA